MRHLPRPSSQNMADQLVAMVQPNRIGALEPRHACHQVRIGRFQNQVIVIAHQAIRVHLPAGFLASLRQRLDEVLSVHVVEVDCFLPVAPAHYVVQSALIFKAELCEALSARN